MTSLHYRIPDAASGYQLDSDKSFWSVCLAEATENLITDPSFEAGTNHSGTGSIGTASYFGASCWVGTNVTRTVVVPTAGAHTFSAYMHRTALSAHLNVRVQIKAGSTVVKQHDYRIDHNLRRWPRIELTWPANAATYTIVVTSLDGAYFATDCWQVEAKPYATTYVDGNLGLYFPQDADEFYWKGSALTSTSVRTAKTRLGGRWVPLGDYGFMTTNIQGFGMPPIEQTFQTSLSGAHIPEAMYASQRELIIGGTIVACSHSELIAKRRDLAKLFAPQFLGVWKPIRLRLQLEAADEEFELLAYYSDGMQGEIDNLYRQNWAISLLADESAWRGRAWNVSLFPAVENGTTYVISKDMESGLWQNWTRSSAGGTTYALDSDGAGGYYSAGTQSGLVHKLRKAGDNTTSTVGGGISGSEAKALAVSKSGPLYILAGGGAMQVGADPIALNLYASGSWQGLKVGAHLRYPWTPAFIADASGNVVNAIEWVNGEFYVGGSFSHVTNDGGGGLYGTPVRHDLLAAYNPVTNTWRQVGRYPLQRGNGDFGVEPPGGPDTHRVTALRNGGDGYLYISGKWLPNTGFTSNGLVRYNIATGEISDVPPAKTFDSDWYGLYSMAMSPYGTLHGVGYDPAITKLIYPYGAAWSERTLQQEGTYTNRISIDFLPDGTLLVGGSLYQWDAFPKQPYSLLWALAPSGNSPSFAPLDLIVDTVTAPAKVFTALRVMDRMPFVALDGMSGILVGTQTTVTNQGTDNARMGLIINQGVTVYLIRNETTGKQIMLAAPITVPKYGLIAITEQHGALYLSDLTQSNSQRRLLPFNRALSDLSALDLAPGDNLIDVMYTIDNANVGGGFSTFSGVQAFWQERHIAL